MGRRVRLHAVCPSPALAHQWDDASVVSRHWTNWRRGLAVAHRSPLSDRPPPTLLQIRPVSAGLAAISALPGDTVHDWSRCYGGDPRGRTCPQPGVRTVEIGERNVCGD